jgi:transcriptional regulator with XRE-family HTH domain
MKVNHPGMAAFGKKVRYYRRINKLSQEKLAEIVGVDYTYISSIERGHRNVSGINIMRLAKALKVQVGDLFPDVRDLAI